MQPQTPPQPQQNYSPQESDVPSPQSAQQYTPTPLQNTQPAPKSPKKSPLRIIVIVILILAIAGAAYAIYSNNKKDKNTTIGGTFTLGNSNNSSSCSPTTATTLDQASAIKTYEEFAKAVASKNQSCADTLSSSFFLSDAKQEFAAPDGKWITAKPAGVRPMSDDFSQLPANLNSANFKQQDYQRPEVLGSNQNENSSTPVNGIELDYPVDISKYTGNKNEKWELALDFVLENGAVKVDGLTEQPAQ